MRLPIPKTSGERIVFITAFWRRTGRYKIRSGFSADRTATESGMAKRRSDPVLLIKYFDLAVIIVIGGMLGTLFCPAPPAHKNVQ